MFFAEVKEKIKSAGGNNVIISALYNCYNSWYPPSDDSFDEWASKALLGKIRLHNCRHIGKEREEIALALFRNMYPRSKEMTTVDWMEFEYKA